MGENGYLGCAQFSKASKELEAALKIVKRPTLSSVIANKENQEGRGSGKEAFCAKYC